jgi:ribosomal protein L15E
MLCYLVVLKYHRDLQLPQKDHKVSAICGNMKHKHRAVGLRQAGSRSRGLVLRMYDLAYMLVGLQLKGTSFRALLQDVLSRAILCTV